MKINSIKEVELFLDSIPKFSDEGETAADFSLDRFKNFCDSLGNPQREFASIHVAGSNGKGSTCQIIASIYQETRHKVGVFTSPHLIDYRERFAINGAQINEKELLLFFQKYLPQIKSFRLTYFEIATAIAFWWFARKEVDIGIIETGLGGRLDATNIITPLISVITSVTLEHTAILGNTLTDIAREKGGIIKPGRPVVVGRLPEEAEREIKKIAVDNKSTFIDITALKPAGCNGKYEFTVGNDVLQFTSQLTAPVQAYNIAMAWQVANLLKEQIPVNTHQIYSGIEKAGSAVANRGRFERLHPAYDWYFDGAHNAEAIKAMKQAAAAVGNSDDAILVLSLMKDKINKKMMNELLDFKKIVYYTLSTKRGANLGDIVRWIPRVSPFPADQKSRHNLFDEFNSKLVIFGGSFYFYSTVQNWITIYTQSR